MGPSSTLIRTDSPAASGSIAGWVAAAVPESLTYRRRAPKLQRIQRSRKSSFGRSFLPRLQEFRAGEWRNKARFSGERSRGCVKGAEQAPAHQAVPQETPRATHAAPKCEAANNKHLWNTRSEGASERAREGGIGGEVSERYVSVVTLGKVTEMPGHPARRGESNHAVSARAPRIGR